MKAMVIEKFGTSEEVKLKEVPIPKPQEHEILIRIEYAAVNPVDWKICEGMLKSRLPHQFPLILGWDASGIISDVGKNVYHLKEGDPVYAYCRKSIVKEGTYAEYICIDSLHAALKPQNISFAQAAAIPLAALTAWQALFDFAHLKENQTILIHAGAGGVGSFAIQFAKFVKAKVITTCSTSNHQYVRQLGADEVIDYNKENFAEAIKKLSSNGVDVVFDTVGGKTLQQSYALVKKGGTLVSIVEMPQSKEEKIRTGFVFVRPDGKQLSEISALIEKGIVKPPAIEEKDLQDAKEALEKSKKGHTRGKIVLKIN